MAESREPGESGASGPFQDPRSWSWEDTRDEEEPISLLLVQEEPKLSKKEQEEPKLSRKEQLQKQKEDREWLARYRGFLAKDREWLARTKYSLDRYRGFLAKAKDKQSRLEEEKSRLNQEYTQSVEESHRREVKTKLDTVNEQIQGAKGEQEEHQKMVERWEELIQRSEQHQDREYMTLLDNAMKSGYVIVRIVKCVIVGPAGVGKTCLKLLLLGKKPPDTRCSTPLAEKPIRAVSGARIELTDEGWHEVSEEELLVMVAEAIPIVWDNLPEDELPSELLEALQQIQPGESSVASDLHATKAEASATNPQNDATTDTPVQKATNSILEKLRKKVQEVDEGSQQQKSTESHSLHNTDFIQFIDSGGQPQFQELLPIFIHNTAATVFVLKLSDRLDEKPTVEYYDHRGQPVGTPSQAPLTNENILKCMVRTMQSRKTQSDNPKVLIVGTHKDKEDQCSESLREKNDKLCEMFRPHMQDDVIFQNQGLREVVFPVNAKEPKAEEQKIATELRKEIEGCAAKPVKIPIWWYILELILQHVAFILNRRMLSKKECLQVAHKLGFTESALDAALRYLTELNIILYYPHVLPNIVFMDSQVPLDKISQLVEYSFFLRDAKHCTQLKDTSPVAGKWRRFRDQGIITIEFLAQFPDHYNPDLFTPEDLLKLLKELLVLAHVSREEYFMPSLLEMLPKAKVTEIRQTSSTIEPLLIYFPHGWPRSGVFCCLVTYLITHCRWQVLLRSGDPILVSRNVIKFRILSSPPFSVTLIDSFAYFEVLVKASPAICHKVCPSILQTISEGIHEASNVLQYNNSNPKPAIFCPHSSDNGHAQTVNDSHPAELTEDHAWWMCTIDADLCCELNERQNVWFQKPLTPLKGHPITRSQVTAPPLATQPQPVLQAPQAGCLMAAASVRPRTNPAAAASAFRQCSAQLLRAIEDPEDLAWELYASGVISDETVDKVSLESKTRRQRNSDLLAAVRDQIAVDPTKFHSVLKILKKVPAMAEITRQLEAAYTSSVS